MNANCEVAYIDTEMMIKKARFLLQQNLASEEGDEKLIITFKI
jgi:hypothetical protein